MGDEMGGSWNTWERR